MSSQRHLTKAAKRLAGLLRQTNTKIVFAESCTGGLVSSTMTRIAGISEWHCGSAVVYRLRTKSKWLGVSPDILEKPGPVSRVVAVAMAEGVLRQTPEAGVAASVTGHLGPDAPRNQNGLIYVAVALRTARRDHTASQSAGTIVRKINLDLSAETLSGSRQRIQRQMSATEQVLLIAADVLAD